MKIATRCFTLALAAFVVSALFVVDAQAASFTTAAVGGLMPDAGNLIDLAAGLGAAGTIQSLREKRNEIAKSVRNLLDKQTQGAEWDEEKQAKYDESISQIENLDARIQREQKLLDLTAEEHFRSAGGTEHEVPAAQASEIRKLFAKWAKGGDKSLSAEDWATVRNTMSTGTGSEGGFTVPTEVATSIADALKEYGGVREVADVIRTEDGGPMNFPTSDGTSEEGELVGENATAADEDPAFGVKSLNTYKFGSKVITVPIELLQDSATDIEAFIRGRIVDRLGRVTNRYFTTGTGTAQPMGVVTASAAGKVGAVSATAVITYDDLVDLQHAVDPAYRKQNPVFMMHDDTVKLIRKLKDNDGRPVFLPSYDAGIRGGVPAELLGSPINYNQQMAVPAASAKSILFGAFMHYKVRDAMAMQLFRFDDSAYVKKGQIGFLAWMRAGGQLVDVGGAIAHFQHGAAA